MLYIGVDLGTSAVKLLLMEGNGAIKKIVSKEYPLFFPNPGWSEQKPEDWWTQVIAGIKELTSECDKSQVAGISFGGQMHGLVILDVMTMLSVPLSFGMTDVPRKRLIISTTRSVQRNWLSTLQISHSQDLPLPRSFGLRLMSLIISLRSRRSCFLRITLHTS